MSSRSNGVTKVVLTLLTIAWVVSSAACSASRIRRGDVGVVGALGEHLGEQLGADHQVLCRLGEEVVERRVDRPESQTHG